MKTFLNLFKKSGNSTSQNIEMLALNDFNHDTFVSLELLPYESFFIFVPTMSNKFKYELEKFQLNFSKDYYSLKLIRLLKPPRDLSPAFLSAKCAFQLQSENKKLEPVTRFWPKLTKDQTLKEQAIRAIAKEEIRTGSTLPDSDLLPPELISLIDERLVDFSNGAGIERLNDLISAPPLPHYILSPN